MPTPTELRKMREEMNLSQSTLAEALETHESTVKNWERGISSRHFALFIELHSLVVENRKLMLVPGKKLKEILEKHVASLGDFPRKKVSKADQLHAELEQSIIETARRPPSEKNKEYNPLKDRFDPADGPIDSDKDY
jgi:transcriptional regulator with XRE-family HTH domain